MKKNNIKRSVTGNPGDPTSRRNLSCISEQQSRHIKLCLAASIREAEAFVLMDDEQMEALLQNAESVNIKFLLPGISPDNLDKSELREFFGRALKNYHSLLVKFQDEGGQSLSDITPGEYETFINSLQAGGREAMIYTQISKEDFITGVQHLKKMYADWELAPWVHYDPYLEQFPEFFEKREEIIISILEVANQPYPGMEYCAQDKVST